MDTPLTDTQAAKFVDDWLRDPTKKCGFCGDHTTECANAAALSVGRRFAVPCGA